MRILVVTSSYPRDAGDPSGHFVRTEARLLAAEGHDVHVVCPHGAVCDAGVTLHAAGGGAAFGWPGVAARIAEAPWRAPLVAGYLLGARRLVWRLGGDRVIAHWLVPSAWPLCAGLEARTEAVVHGGDVRLLLRAPRRVRAALLARLLTRGLRFRFAAASLRATLGDGLDGALRVALERQSRIEPPPMDTIAGADRGAVRRRLGIGADERLAVACGRLVAQKRIDQVLAAIACLEVRPRLVVVGDGPEQARLEATAARLGVTVRFTGRLPRAEALDTIGAADVLVHASRDEGAPTVVREARALGVPVVACPSGDLERWATSDPGIHVADEPGLARALAAVLGAVT